MPSTLAPDRLGVGSRRIPSRDIRPPEGEDTLSQELRTVGLLRPHVLVGYRWSYIGLCPGSKSSHNRYIRSFVSQLPQIRTCTLNASGSSRCGIAVPHTTGLSRGDTLLRHGVLGVVPTPRPQRGTPFAPRGPEGPFPRFDATMGHCDFLTAFSPRFVSFAWRYLGAPAFRPRSAADAWPTDHPGVCCTGCSRSGFLQGAVRISQVPVKPVRSFAMFLRPRCDQARLWVQV